MTWRWVWATSQVTPVMVSALLWLVILALAPAAVAVVILLSVVSVAGWNSSWLLRWRFGARRMPDADRDAVLRALVPVQALRGRNQPELWASRRLATSIIAPAQGRFVVGERLIGQVGRGQLTDEDLSRRAVRALSMAEVNASRLVASVEFFTLPWLLLAAVITPMRDRVVQVLPVSRFAWSVRWLFVGLAIADLGQRALWVPLVMLVLTAIATVTTPRANHAWAACLTQLADMEAKRHGFGPTRQSGANGPTPSRPGRSRPTSPSRTTETRRAR